MPRRQYNARTKAPSKYFKKRSHRGYRIMRTIQARAGNPDHKFQRSLSLDNVQGGSLSASATATFQNNPGYLYYVTTAATGIWYGTWGFNFRLSDLPDSGEFQNLFDRYKITGVKIKVMPLVLAVDNGTGNRGLSCILHDVIDHDDSSAPAASATGLKNLQEYESYKCTDMAVGKQHKRYIVPRNAVGVYAGAFTSYGNVRNMWIDAASPDVQYYGWKGMLEILNDTGIVLHVSLKVTLKYYLVCKDLH